MTARTKIIGLKRGNANIAEAGESLDLSVADISTEQEPQVANTQWLENASNWEEQDEEAAPSRRWPSIVFLSLLILTAVCWTSFFAWANLVYLTMSPTPAIITSLVASWSAPLLCLGVAWLIFMRSSRAEANRFADVGAALRKESEALETRMRTVNEEIALARGFLAENAKELDSIGRQSAKKMVASAEALREALADSEQKAQQLEVVSNAATTNLEQLRKHLPVVTSAAKDATNQIGSAGNNAQLQVKSLIDALSHVSQAGENARSTVAELSNASELSATHIGQQFGALVTHMASTLADAEGRSSAIVTHLDHSSQHARQQLAETAAEMQTILAEIEAGFSSNVSQMQVLFTTTTQDGVDALDQRVSAMGIAMSDRQTHLQKQLEQMDLGLTELAHTFAKHDADIDQLIIRIANVIDDSRTRIKLLDDEATEQTTRLAFAFQTLVKGTQDLDSALGGSNNNATRLLSDANGLIVTLDEIRDQMDDKLPAILDRMDQNFTTQLAQIGTSRDAATQLDQHSNAMLARIVEVDTRIKEQQMALDALVSSGDTQMAGYQTRSDALLQSLTSTRSMVEAMSAEASGELLSSLKKIGDESHRIARDSRHVIEEELANIGTRLSGESEKALQQAVAKQLEAVRASVGAAIDRQLDGAQLAVDAMTTQLARLDEMASNLELRLKDTHDGFGGMDDANFARRMALLTESLNSTAIDVAKILSNEVTDTAWASYLKGDRGVFTRRAVRLLDNGEARAIAQHYDEDTEFRNHVNRYIHDFEAMMRVLLSSRDGNAVGVTVLSSDVGKLYVALAQAIERLRN